MKKLTLLLALLFFSFWSLTIGQNNDHLKADVRAGQTLKINWQSGGDIIIKSGPQNVVTVKSNISKNENCKVQLTGTNFGYLLESYWTKSINKVNTDVEIIVPANFNIDIESRGVNLTLNKITGEFKVNIGGGSLNITEVNGKMEASLGGGDVNIRDSKIMGDIKIGGGSVYFNGFRGECIMDIKGGDFVLENIHGTLIVNTNAGNITVKNLDSNINAKTNTGNIEAYISNSGEKRNMVFSTNDGNVEINLKQESSVKLYSEIKHAGKKQVIKSDFNLEITESEHKLGGNTLRNIKGEGMINNGQNSISLISSNGSITIKKY